MSRNLQSHPYIGHSLHPIVWQSCRFANRKMAFGAALCRGSHLSLSKLTIRLEGRLQEYSDKASSSKLPSVYLSAPDFT